MKILKVIIIMTVLLMVFNASASELQHFSNEPFNVSEQTDDTPDVLHQEQQTLVSFEITTSYCEQEIEDT
jgi:hypothetical protein